MTANTPTLPQTLAEHVARHAAHAPQSEAAVDESGRWTFAQLHQQVQCWAAALAAQGVRPGDRIAMLAPPGRASLVCLLPTLRQGAVWCGLDPRLREPELEHRLGDLQPRMVLAFVRIGERDHQTELTRVLALRAAEADLVWIDGPDADNASLAAFLAQGGSIDVPPDRSTFDARQAALIVYTSGSSGVPKGAMLHEAGIVDFCRQQNALWPAQPLRTLNFLPISHVGSLVDLSLPAVVAGGCVVFQRKFDALASLQIIERERISFWGSVPSTFVMQLELPQFKITDLSSVQVIAIEGAAIPPELAAALLPIAPIATNYGMTETTSAITAMAPTRSGAELDASVGHPLAGTELRIAADAPAEAGEIEVRSPRNLVGYWRQPHATADAFTDDGFFRTGDLGVLLPDGSLRLVGRKKEMFKSGGYNVYPAEIEAVIGSHPAVEMVAVVPVPHATWGEVGVACVSLRPGSPVEALPQALDQLCRERLADYKRPKRTLVLAALPLLPIGKVDRQALRALAAQPGTVP